MKTTWKLGLGLTLTLTLLGGGAALAEPADSRAKLDERIDMKLKDAAPADLFGTFAKLFGAEAVVDPAVREPVSIELHNVRARTLLDTICEGLGCRWSLEPGSPPKLRVTPAPAGRKGAGSEANEKPASLREPIDLKVTQADGLDLFQTFAQILGADLVLDPAVAGNVSLNLQSTPVEQTLDALCQTLGCDWRYTEGANGKKPVLRVSSRQKKR
jgi:type II secretory pathway component GspD/PulD (secretin)